MNTDSKILKKILAKRIQTYIYKKVICNNRIVFILEIQGWFKIHKSSDVIKHTVDLKTKIT